MKEEKKPCGCDQDVVILQPPVVEVGAQFRVPVENQTLRQGLKEMRRIKAEGEIAERYQIIRMEACKACPERIVDVNTGMLTGERIYREIRGTSYCGAPWYGKMLGRSPFHQGCGCKLIDKVKWEASTCPRKRWGPGTNFGAGVFTIFDNRAEKGTLKNALDVHVMSRLHKPDITGIGDTLAFLPIVHAIQRKFPDRLVRYAIMSGQDQWAKLGYEYTTFEDDGERQPAELELWGSDLNLSGLDLVCLERGWNRHQYWENKLNVTAERFLLQPDPEYLLEAKQQLADPILKGQKIVAMSPHTAQNLQRNWPRRHWLVLFEKLKREGVYLYVIDGPNGSQTSMFNCRRLLGEPAQRLVAYLSLTDLHLGNDSGMNHLAGMVGTPAIVIASPTIGDQVYGWYGNVQSIQGQGSCTGCYWDETRGWELPCQSGCILMWNIRPEMVFEAVMERIALEEEVAA